MLHQQLTRSRGRDNITHPKKDETCSAWAECSPPFTTQIVIKEDQEVFNKTYQKYYSLLYSVKIFKMIPDIATNIIVQIIKNIIDNISKTVDENQNILYISTIAT